MSQLVFKSGDLFRSDVQTLTNAVNVVGVMGAGIAKEFKRKFPDMFKDYQQKCKANEVVIGKPYVWRPNTFDGKWVLNFPTKRHWRGASRIEWIEEGLDHLVHNYRTWGITSLALPALGCSLGGLSWKDVKPLLSTRLSGLDIPIEIYEPLEARVPSREFLHGVRSGRSDLAKSKKESASKKQFPLL